MKGILTLTIAEPSKKNALPEPFGGGRGLLRDDGAFGIGVVVDPDSPAMSLDNPPADREPHAQSGRFRGDEVNHTIAIFSRVKASLMATERSLRS
jgi:hypothetical protein